MRTLWEQLINKKVKGFNPKKLKKKEAQLKAVKAALKKKKKRKTRR